MSGQTTYPTENLANFLKTKKIATIEQLKQEVGTQVDLTITRKLKALGYKTSYSHRGRFYTLEVTPQFDERGLWNYQGVCFSSHGTLKRTLVALVQESDDGFFAKELEEILKVTVKDPLRKLVQEDKVAKKMASGRALYCSPDPGKSKQQVETRRKAENLLMPSPSAEVANDEVKAAIILFLSLLNEKQVRLYAGLEALKWGPGGDTRVGHLLDLDVKTVARGRHELLRGETGGNRIRKPGAGRKPVKKKRRESSRGSGS